jgi:hypothetical protein
LSLTFFTQHYHLQFHSFSCKWGNFIILWLSNTPRVCVYVCMCVCVAFSLSSHCLMGT